MCNSQYLRYSLSLYLELPRVLWRLGKSSSSVLGYWKRISQSLGFFPKIKKSQPIIWVYACMISEVQQGIILVKKLRSQYPDIQFVFTVNFPESDSLIHRELKDFVSYGFSPLDTPGAVRRFLRRTKPNALYMVCPILRPNLFKICRIQNIPILIVNANNTDAISVYQCRKKELVFPTVNSITFAGVENKRTKDHFINHGMTERNCKVIPNTKFDLKISAEMREKASTLRTNLFANKAHIIVAGSTHAGEEAEVVEAFTIIRKQFPNTKLILAPRFVETCNALETMFGSDNNILRHSELLVPVDGIDILLVDTLGDLRWIYGTADVAFIGGSLVRGGGHNLLEPAIWGIPVLTGPSLGNFELCRAYFEKAGVLNIVNNSTEMSHIILAMFSDKEYYRNQCFKTKAVLNHFGGSMDAFVKESESILDGIIRNNNQN